MRRAPAATRSPASRIGRGSRPDIDFTIASEAGNRVLVLFELEGLQAYNDRFGFAAGDTLLRSFAVNLVSSVAPLGGIAYRSDGGRFAVLAPAGSGQLGEMVLAATASLRGDGSAMSLGTTYGEVDIPGEAQDAELALRIAGQRLAAHKQRQHRSARRQAHAVLIAALSARRPDLRDHLRVVAYRAISLSRRLGMDREEIDDVALAAELQDVGLLAVPESRSREGIAGRRRAGARAQPHGGGRKDRRGGPRTRLGCPPGPLQCRALRRQRLPGRARGRVDPARRADDRRLGGLCRDDRAAPLPRAGGPRRSAGRAAPELRQPVRPARRRGPGRGSRRRGGPGRRARLGLVAAAVLFGFFDPLLSLFLALFDPLLRFPLGPFDPLLRFLRALLDAVLGLL